MELSKFQAIYFTIILLLIATFFGINFSGILSTHVNLGMVIYLITVNSLAIMAFFYLNNTENFKKNNLAGLKSDYKKETPWHLIFAIVTSLSIYILQYTLEFSIYCPPGALQCELASSQVSVFTWIAVTGLVFGGVLISFILMSISFVLAVYIPISMILKSPSENGHLIW